MTIIICICTYKRNESLIRLLKSIEKCKKENILIEKIIIDNYKDSTCLWALEKNNINNFFYTIEIKKGLSNARNRALTELKKYNFDYCIFLDDDQVVSENWLLEMIKVLNFTNSDIVKGNVIYLSDIEKKEKNKKVELFYTINNIEDGKKIEYCGLGNTIMRKKVIDENVFFDHRFNYIGGEDTDFFLKLSKLGYKITYSSRGIVYEEVEEDRLSLNYILKRSFIAGFSYLVVLNNNTFKFKIKQTTKSVCKLIINLVVLLFSNIILKDRSVKCLKKIAQSFGEFYYLLDIDVKGIY